MGKIKNFCRRYGVDLKTAGGWKMLLRRMGRFAARHKGDVLGAALRRFRQSGVAERERSYAKVRAACVPSPETLEVYARAVERVSESVSVVIDANEGGEALEDLWGDLSEQILPPREVVLFGGDALSVPEGVLRAPNRRAAYGMLTGDYVVTLRAGDRLEKEGLFVLACGAKGAAAVYTDHDCIVKGEYVRPFFKPKWSPDLFLAYDYVCGAFAARRSLMAAETADESLPLAAFLYDMLLKLSEQGEVCHVAGVFFHLMEEGASDAALAPLRSAAIARRGEGARLQTNVHGSVSIERDVQGEPLVSVIIPTCYTKNYIDRCLASIIKRSSYRRMELIVVDNSRGSRAYGEKRLQKYGCRILYIPEPFNWSRLNNLAAAKAKGDFLLFLNDDTEVLTPDWIERMLAEAARPDVGEVGALLLYPGGAVQHAGGFLVERGGGARHYYQYAAEASEEYRGLLHLRRECSFVTGACVMVERKKFKRLGGFDERFAVVSNDVDFGLRLCAAGYRNLYLPDVRLRHKEKVSRGQTGERAGAKTAWQVWGCAFCLGDGYFNPFLDSDVDTPQRDLYPARYAAGGKNAEQKVFKKSKIAFCTDGLQEIWQAEPGRAALLCRLIAAGTGADILLFGADAALHGKILSKISEPSRIEAKEVPQGGHVQALCEADYCIGCAEGFAMSAERAGTPALLFGRAAEEKSAAGYVSVKKDACCGGASDGGLAGAERLGAGEIWRGLERLFYLFPRD